MLFPTVPAAVFLRDDWPVRHRFAEGPLARLGDLASRRQPVTIEGLLAAHQGEVKVVFSTAAGRYGEAAVQAAQARQLRESGLSVCLTGVHETVPAIGRWARGLARELGLRSGLAQCNAYFSPAGEGFAKHLDDHEVIVVQLAGRKRWHVAENRDIRFPLHPYVPSRGLPREMRAYARECPEAMPADAEALEMAPGAALFLPRGHWHATEALEESLSLTFGFFVPTWADLLLRRMRERLIAREAWREPIHGEATERARALLGDLAAEVAGWRAADLTAGAEMPRRPRPVRTERRLRAAAGASLEVCAVPGRGDRLVKLVIEAESLGISEIEVDAELVAVFTWLHGRKQVFTTGELAAAHQGLTRKVLDQAVELAEEAGLVVEETQPHNRRREENTT